MTFLGSLRAALGFRDRVAAQEPLARALRAHVERGRSVQLHVIRGEGFSYALDTASFFALEGPVAPIDALALETARGRVIDVGAGAGRHSLELESRGHEVVAIDVSATNVALMRELGVADPRQLDVFRLDASDLGRFDTVLFLMQSIGIAGSRFGLESLLEALAPLLAPGGQILLDSSPLEGVPESAGGEVEVQFAFEQWIGEPFAWLYLGYPQLEAWSSALGWRCERLAELESGDYLARLTRPASAGDSHARSPRRA